MSVSRFVGLLSYWNFTNIGIFPVLDEISMNVFETFLGCWYTCYKKFWISCMSLICLIPLLKMDKYRDIYSSRWYIFLKFFGDIPGMFVHLFQIILNFLYVCQSASWLTSLLKLGSYRDISSSVGDISLNFFGGFPGLNLYQIKIIWNFLYVCQSVSWLTPLFKLG